MTNDNNNNEIIRLIAGGGAIPIDQYMALCLQHESIGYYRQGNPLKNDFTTSPQQSQAFGELIGAWLLAKYQRQNCILAELGPGTGAMLADIWRVTGDKLQNTAQITLVESSETLRDIQKSRLAKLHPAPRHPPSWLNEAGELPQGALYLVANEFLDALPVRQYIADNNEWRERGVAADKNGNLNFCLLPARPPLPETKPTDGSVMEFCPAAMSVVEFVARQIAEHGGAALFIDYGYETPPLRSTFSAIRRGAAADPLLFSGDCDLSFFVDFSALRGRVAALGLPNLRCEVEEQGAFLRRHGLEARARTLEQNSPRAATAARGLADTAGLGAFRVMSLTRD
ncbi:MAG: SAM-dependent methyltransferase [Alphaproteobacteria bacterium]|nr:SAM-dependent methyltransferase [Alphaproteobacteria bacterium]